MNYGFLDWFLYIFALVGLVAVGLYVTVWAIMLSAVLVQKLFRIANRPR